MKQQKFTRFFPPPKGSGFPPTTNERGLFMKCDMCRRINGHLEACPNHIPPKTNHYCSICGEGIYNGEEYIKNENNDYRHYECFHGIKDLLQWLGYEIKTMENDTF